MPQINEYSWTFIAFKYLFVFLIVFFSVNYYNFWKFNLSSFVKLYFFKHLM